MRKYKNIDIDKNIDGAVVLAGEKVKAAWRVKRGALLFLESKVSAATEDTEAKTRLAVERAAKGFLEYLTGTTTPCDTEIFVDEAYAFTLEKIPERPSWSPDEVRFFERSPEGERTYFTLVDLGVEKKCASGLTRACVFAALSHRDMTRAEMYEKVLERNELSAKLHAKKHFSIVDVGYESPELCAAI